MIIYLVSGAQNIEPSHKNVKRKGVKVKHGSQVSLIAKTEFVNSDAIHVVIAHGDDEGTVTWENENSNTKCKWVYVGMKHPPTKAKIYFHCCSVGTKLPAGLKKCKILAPSNSVPMPVDEEKLLVLKYLREVEKILETAPQNEWLFRVGEFINEQLVNACLRRNHREASCWSILRKAFAFPGVI